MRRVRLGSSSIATPLPGTADLLRRKSMRRYCRLWPPPWCRVVMWPLLLRPPVRCSGSSRLFSGVLFVISAKSDTERNRVAGVTGLNCRMPISALEHLDRVALFERHDRLFPGRPAAVVAAVGASLCRRRDGAHGGDGHPAPRFERRLDLRLGGLDVHPEGGFLPPGVGPRRLLRDHPPPHPAPDFRHP